MSAASPTPTSPALPPACPGGRPSLPPGHALGPPTWGVGLVGEGIGEGGFKRREEKMGKPTTERLKCPHTDPSDRSHKKLLRRPGSGLRPDRAPPVCVVPLPRYTYGRLTGQTPDAELYKC